MKRNKERIKINRTKYKDIKTYDHATMEDFLTEVYLQGVEKGIKEAESRISATEKLDFNKLADDVRQIKGMGTIKTEQVIKILKERISGDEKTN